MEALSGKKNFLRRAESFILEQHMVKRGDLVLIGLSGGADSVCLTHVLWEISGRLGIELAAVHVNHGIRGKEALRDEEFSRELCLKLTIPFTSVHENVPRLAEKLKVSEEEAGRIARYRIFEEWTLPDGRGADRIAVAHHGGDNAETFLYHLLRGSGAAGLSGISPVRGRVIRPLLPFGKKEIEEYLREAGILFCQDSTNRDNRYMRNRIRNQILPDMEELVNTQAVAHINQAAALIGRMDQYLQEEAHKTGALEIGEKGCQIKKEIFQEMPQILQGYVWREALQRLPGRGRDITEKHYAALTSLMESQCGRMLYLPGGIRAGRNYQGIFLCREERKNSGKGVDDFSVFMRVFPRRPGEKIPENRYTKWFDYDKINNDVVIRTRRTGDYIEIAPGSRKKTVKAYMIDEKIPREERDRIPLAADGSHILWIIGYRMSEGYKITENTKNVLEIQMRREEDE